MDYKSKAKSLTKRYTSLCGKFAKCCKKKIYIIVALEMELNFSSHVENLLIQ